ncbi:hypothetical protein AB833_13735 [Chromatiales bacterium (ex Bugula neritina AB1)]|nr:hypothetical protein AB833_13735 [Chromatiales bacterium (ex Bugula neritina AB1)]
MNSSAQILAIGGGGFTHATDPVLETYLLSISPVNNPSIGFLPTASGDSETRIKRFYSRFSAETCRPDHLALFGSVSEVERWVKTQDIIYVGGGNTKSMLGVWREWGLPELLREACHRGTILSGVSAGAVCWFDIALSDSGGRGLEPLPMLQLLRGSCCPHYTNEPNRQQAFESQIQSGKLPAGFGIDDGVALHFSNGNLEKVIKTREQAAAYSVCAGATAPVVKQLS